MVQFGSSGVGQSCTLHELLASTDVRMRAPEFQRHYVWTATGSDSQIGRFWEDFDRLTEDKGDDPDNPQSLFLGAIVLQVIDPGRPGNASPLYSIIDGQQRLLTVTLVLIALAEAFQDAGDPDEAEEMERAYLLSQAKSTKGQPAIEPTISDRRVMRRIYECLRHPKPQLDSWDAGPDESELFRSWQSIRAEVRRRCTSAIDKDQLDLDLLRQMRDDLALRTEIVPISLEPRHDPFEVYERLNQGGKPLTELDFVRNAVFQTLGSDSQAALRVHDAHWRPFEDDLGEHAAGYWLPFTIIRDPSTLRKSIYPNLQRYWRKKFAHLNGEPLAEQIVGDLRTYLPAYRAIVDDYRPRDTSPRVWEALERLRRMDAPNVMHSYLFELVYNHLGGNVDEQEVIDTIDIIDAFLTRRFFAGVANQGIWAAFKTLWATIENDDDKISRLDSFARRIADTALIFPDDDVFREDIKTRPIYRLKRQRVAYVLTEFERDFDTGDLSQPWPHEIEVDHVMPQSPAAGDWDHVTVDDREALSDTWANLVPLKEANPQKSNKSFEAARRMMIDEQGTVFKSTRALFDQYDQWDAETIRERAQELAEWAVQRWPKPEV